MKNRKYYYRAQIIVHHHNIRRLYKHWGVADIIEYIKADHYASLSKKQITFLILFKNF